MSATLEDIREAVAAFRSAPPGDIIPVIGIDSAGVLLDALDEAERMVPAHVAMVEREVERLRAEIIRLDCVITTQRVAGDRMRDAAARQDRNPRPSIEPFLDAWDQARGQR